MCKGLYMKIMKIWLRLGGPAPHGLSSFTMLTSVLCSRLVFVHGVGRFVCSLLKSIYIFFDISIG